MSSCEGHTLNTNHAITVLTYSILHFNFTKKKLPSLDMMSNNAQHNSHVIYAHKLLSDHVTSRKVNDVSPLSEGCCL
jgi:hypothetical protein